MAVPAITNNSPSPGYISWNGFTIQLYGVAYAVPAGSTNQRWTWWEYRNGTPIINAGPDIPSTITDDDLVLFGNKAGIGIRVQSTNLIDGELLVDGSVFADAIAANQISTNHIATVGLDAGVVKFGSMSGDRILANTIGSNHIVTAGLDAGVIKFGTMSGDRILANTISSNHIVTAGLDAGVIKFGSMSGDRILANTLDASKIVAGTILTEKLAAGAVTASKLTLADISNIITDPTGALGSPSWYYPYVADKSIPATTAGVPASAPALDVIQMPVLANAVNYIGWRPLDSSVGNKTPVTPGETYYMEAMVASTANANANTYLQVNLYDQNSGAGVAVYPTTQLIPGTSWRLLSGKFTVPAGKYLAVCYVIVGNPGATPAGTWYATNIKLRKAADASLIVDGSILARHISAGAITADMISSGSIHSDLALLGSLNVGGITIDPNSGISIPQSLGGVTQFPADGSPSSFGGDAVLLSALVQGALNIRGTDNYLAGILTAASGIVDPQAAPTVTSAWPKVAIATAANEKAVAMCKHINGVDRLAYVQDDTTDTSAPYSCTLYVVHPDGSRSVQALSDGGVQGYPLQMCTDGTYYYVLDHPGPYDDVVVRRYNSSFTFVNQWVSPIPSYIGIGAMNYDGAGNLIFAYAASNRASVIVQLANPSTGALVGASISLPISSPYDPCGIKKTALYGSGTVKYVVAFYDSIKVFESASPYSRVTAYEPALASSKIMALYDSFVTGAMFETLDANSQFYTYANSNARTNQAQYTWYDSDAGGTYGVGESKPSSIKSTSIARGAWALFTSAPIPDGGSPDDPNAIRVYMTETGGTLKRQPDLAAGQTTVWYPFVTTTGVVPPTTSSFASRPGAVGALKSANTDAGGSMWSLSGDGAYRVGDLHGDIAGTALDAVVAPIKIKSEVWHNITGWANGYSAVAGFTPQYRLDAAGNISLRGRMNVGTSGAVAFVLPVGARPTVDMHAFLLWAGGSFGTLDILANGNVLFFKQSSTGAAFLNSIMFSTL